MQGPSIVRRCAIYRGRISVRTLAVVEENLIIGGGRWIPEMEPPQFPRNQHYGGGLWKTALRIGNAHYALVRYNVFADAAGWGFWSDVMCYGTYLYGNTFWRNWGGGIYNEANCHDSRILYNAVVENGSWGIALRQAHRVLMQYNLLENNDRYGVGFWNLRMWPTPTNNHLHHNLIRGQRSALMFEALDGHALQQAMTNSYDHNIYGSTPEGPFALPDVATLADFQKLTRMDANSRVDDHATMEDFGLGTATFRIPDCDDPATPVPMVVNTVSRGLHQEPLGLGDMNVPLFWNFGNADKLPSDSWRSDIYGYMGPFHQNRGSLRRLGRWEAGAVSGMVPSPDGKPAFWMEAVSDEAGAGSPDGKGWWGRSLPTVPGARIHVSVAVSGEDLAPAKRHAVVVFLRFSSLTNQHVSRRYLIGGDDEKALDGTFAWRTIDKEFVAPSEARRFALFMGLQPCTGTARFARIRIQTRPGEQRAPLVMPPDVTHEPLDLAGFFNRDLDDNVTGRTGDGLEGWPRPMDLSTLRRGRQLHASVPFQVDRAIALRGSMFPQDKTLPREVRGIPVKRKVAGIFFLYRVSYPAYDREQYRFILHLADGSNVQIPFYSGWPAATQQAMTRDVRRLPGHVLEWVNPQPQVVVEQIDFIAADTGEPVLLGITAATDG